MSLYVGKNNDNKSILHIYNNSMDIEKNVFSGTIFHSNLPYIRFINKVTFYPTTGPVVGDNAFVRHKLYATTGFVDLNAGNVVFVGYKGIDRVFFNPQVFNTEDSAYTPKYYQNAIGQIGLKSSTEIYCSMPSSYEDGNIGSTIYYDKIDMYYFTQTAQITTATSVKINNTGVFLDDVNLFDYGYAIRVTTPVNTNDDILYIPCVYDFLQYASFAHPGRFTNLIQYGNSIPVFKNAKSKTDPGGLIYETFQILGSYSFNSPGISIDRTGLYRKINGVNIPCFVLGTSLYKKVSEGAITLPDFSTFPAALGVYFVANLPSLANINLMTISISFSGVIRPALACLTSSMVNNDYSIFNLSNSLDFLFIRKVGDSLTLYLSKSQIFISSATHTFAKYPPTVHYKLFR